MLNGAIPVSELVDRGESVEISGRTDGAAVLLLSDLYYPGWNAVLTQSGASVTVPIEPAFGHWRAVFIPQKGRFQIRFQYQPESFAVGWQISMAMGILCLIGMAVVIMFRRSPQQADCAG